MRGINSETVDLIYLDPPFNSNRTYSAPIGSKAAGAAFEDTWTLDKEDVAWMGLIADQHPAIHSVIAAAGEAHSTGMQSYLRMMAVRLLEMRRVLAPAGSIYLHCDPAANSYLRLLLDATFGSDHQKKRDSLVAIPVPVLHDRNNLVEGTTQSIGTLKAANGCSTRTRFVCRTA